MLKRTVPPGSLKNGRLRELGSMPIHHKNIHTNRAKAEGKKDGPVAKPSGDFLFFSYQIDLSV